MENLTDYDVVVVGGSYAGLSAAMALGRAMKKVALVDSGKPCNAQTPQSHNFITHDGEAPAVIAATARNQVLAYPTIDPVQDLVTSVTGADNHFTVTTEAGKVFTSKKILFATGVKDFMPEIPGFANCWGISVIHCPYCHGYEYRGEETGILLNNPLALDFARFIRNWTPRLTLFTNGPATFDETVKDLLAKINVPVNEKYIGRIDHENGHIQQLVFEDNSSIQLNAMYARPAFEQHCPIPQQLGCGLNEQGYLIVDGSQKTTVPGIYAAGDNTTMVRAVSTAVAAGGLAGARMSHELINEQYS
jgi:thioredoxin reductase